MPDFCSVRMSEADEAKWRAHFDKVDNNKNGYMSVGEIQSVLADMGRSQEQVERTTEVLYIVY